MTKINVKDDVKLAQLEDEKKEETYENKRHTNIKKMVFLHP